MKQQPDFTRRRIALASCAMALLVFANHADPPPVIGTIAIASTDAVPMRIHAAAAPLVARTVALIGRATKRFMP